MSTSSNGAPRNGKARAAAANDGPAPPAELRTVALSRIHVEEGFNPRQRFDQAELERLARSIRLRGLLQPLVVAPNGEDGFRLLAGERRYRAAALASVTEVPVIVRQVSEDTRGLDDALVENMSRQDLDPVEQATGFQRLLDGGLTRKGVVELLGVSQKLVADRLQILALPEELHPQIADGTIPPSAVKPLADLAKAHAGLPVVAVRCVLSPEPQPYHEPPSWADLADDPVELIWHCASDEDLPSDVYRSGESFPLSRFTLSDKAAADLEKLLKLLGETAEGVTIRLSRGALEQALALKAVLATKSGYLHGAFILGQDVADQLASDRVSDLLKEERARRRREREWEGSRAARADEAASREAGGESGAEPVEDPAEQRRREAAERAERKRAATAYNAELGAAVYGKLSRIKVDERVLKVLAAVGFHADLGHLAGRGARYGFPGWVVETTTKGGKPKIEYLGATEAEQKAREYLAGAKTAGDIAGRLFALVAMAVYAQQEAVAQSSRVYWDVSFHNEHLPWSREVVALVEQIAEERLPEPLTEPRKLERKQRERDERERQKAERVRAQAKDELAKRLPKLSAEERKAELERFREQHGWSRDYWELQNLVTTLSTAGEPASEPEQPSDEEHAEGAALAEPDVDDSELDYSEGEGSEEPDVELVAA
jgi:ParB/RepB/Spo0J family partition protein